MEQGVKHSQTFKIAGKLNLRGHPTGLTRKIRRQLALVNTTMQQRYKFHYKYFVQYHDR